MGQVIDLNQRLSERLSARIAEGILQQDEMYRAMLYSACSVSMTDADKARVAAEIPARFLGGEHEQS